MLRLFRILVLKYREFLEKSWITVGIVRPYLALLSSQSLSFVITLVLGRYSNSAVIKIVLHASEYSLLRIFIKFELSELPV